MRTKTCIFQLFFSTFFAFIFLFTGLAGQEDVVEEVRVVNREVVVRVFDGGEPVPGLTRADFTLRENGEPTVITSCRQVRRSLAPAQGVPETAETFTEMKPPRLFLFLLWWNEESNDWPKAWKYFLENIYRPGDRVILAGDRHAVQIPDPEKDRQILAEFFLNIHKEFQKKKQDKVRLTGDLETCARNFHEMLNENARKKNGPKIPEWVLLNQFKGNYRGVLDEYRLKRLRAQPKMMHQLAGALRKVDTEKWALVFLQNERLPLVDMQSSLLTVTPMSFQTRQKLSRFIEECDHRIRMANDMAVHVRDLRSMFIGAGATFHLFLSDAKGETLGDDLLHWLPVFSSWESAFRGIAKDTGGDVKNTTKLREALEKAAMRPDIYYVLTYKPKETVRKKPRLSIKVSRPGLKVVYARRLRPREIRPLKLWEPVWKEGVLRFNLSDYLRETGKDACIAGDVHIKVSTETLEGKPLEFEKTLRPGDESTQVEMKVNFPEPGDYILTVAARDRMSGNTARNYTRVFIAPPEPEPEPEMAAELMSPELVAVLEKAATYCQKLQRAALRFTCTEVVDEMVLKRNPLKKRVEPEERQWRYDYQVVVDKGEITEQRRLVRAKHKKVNIPDAKLETRFKAHYSVFLPVTLLGKRNHKNYRYTLVETARLKKRNCAIIEVTPRRTGEGPLARGRAWVDVDDGSTLKIEMDPHGVHGSAALEAAASRMSARLDLMVTHWYLEARKGLRFPSSAEFSESYVFDKRVTERKAKGILQNFALHGESYAVGLPTIESRHRRVEFYRMSQTYRKYRYFEVETRVEVQSAGQM